MFRIEVNHVKSGFFLLPSETKFSLQFQISLPKRKRGRTLHRNVMHRFRVQALQDPPLFSSTAAGPLVCNTLHNQIKIPSFGYLAKFISNSNTIIFYVDDTSVTKTSLSTGIRGGGGLGEG